MDGKDYIIIGLVVLLVFAVILSTGVFDNVDDDYDSYDYTVCILDCEDDFIGDIRNLNELSNNLSNNIFRSLPKQNYNICIEICEYVHKTNDLGR